MKHFDFKFLRVWMVLWCAGVLLPAAGQGSAGSADVLRLIEKVNDYWQANNSPKTRAFWDNAAYYTGNMEAYRLTPGRLLIMNTVSNGASITVGGAQTAMTNGTGSTRRMARGRISCCSATGRFVSRPTSTCII